MTEKSTEPVVRTDVAEVVDGVAHPLYMPIKEFETFPVDVFTDAACIAYQVSDLPPSKFSDKNDVVPSVRFLFSDGKDIRKWTNWYRISYHAKASLLHVFTGFPNLVDVLTNDDRLFDTPFKILNEKRGETFTNIIKVKPGNHNMQKTAFYDDKFVPYRYVKAFGNLVNLRLAVVKTKEGIRTLTEKDFVDPPNNKAVE